MELDRAAEEQLIAKVQQGFLIESPEEMTPGYRNALIQTLMVSADTELMSAPSYHLAARKAPTANALITALAIIQDELGHAHIAYRLLQDLGVDSDQLVYERPAAEFKHPYAFDMPLRTWTELVVANALWDRAGYGLLGDVYKNTSYGPWKRALSKVDKEEFFHLRQGENWLRILTATPDGKAEIQRAVDWMFPMAFEWFGLPDALKRHSAQLDYHLKGLTNDQLRQQWLNSGVPVLEANGITVPVKKDPETGDYAVTYAFPCAFDEEEQRWLFDQPITWDEVMARWRRRGPMNEEYVAAVRRGHRDLARLRSAS